MTKFSDLMKEIQQQAEAEGPEAVQQLKDFQQFYHQEMINMRNQEAYSVKTEVLVPLGMLLALGIALYLGWCY